MDSGCVESPDDLEELYDVTQPLLPEEVLGIIDQLLCHEVSLLADDQVQKLTYLSRWHGIKDIPFHRHCSPACTQRHS